MRVFFDTNVLISAYTARGLSAELFRLVLTGHELLTGEVNLLEFRRVLLQRFEFPLSVVEMAEAELREHTIVPKPDTVLDLEIRDVDDTWVLASAVEANSPWQKSSRHSTVPASRRTALRFGHILPVCTRIAPCPAGAGTVSVLAGLLPRTAKCDALVTGDKDLLDVDESAPIPILTPRECWQQLRSR